MKKINKKYFIFDGRNYINFIKYLERVEIIEGKEEREKNKKSYLGQYDELLYLISMKYFNWKDINHFDIILKVPEWLSVS